MLKLAPLVLVVAFAAHAEPPVPVDPLVDAPVVDAPVADAPVVATPATAAPLQPPLDDIGMRELPPPSIGLADLLGPILKTMLMLCVVLAVAYVTLNKGLGKLTQRQNAGKRMKVVERTALDSKRTLFLVDVDGKQMMLAAGEGGVVLIKDFSASGGTSDPALGARFAEALSTVARARAPNPDEKA